MKAILWPHTLDLSGLLCTGRAAFWSWRESLRYGSADTLKGSGDMGRALTLRNILLAITEKQRCVGKVPGLAEVERGAMEGPEFLGLRVLNRYPVAGTTTKTKLTQKHLGSSQ